MKGELERKISQELSKPQIRALALIRRSVNELYSEVHSELIGRYISDSEEIDRWKSINSKDKVESLPKFLESLRGRWIADLATQFCPANLNQEMAEKVVLQILKRAVKEGDLESETADNEYRYRCSVGSFLVSEDLVKKLGSEHFVLYDKERGIYYPTKEGRALLATIGGYASLKQSKGVHGLSKEQRILNARKAGKKGGPTSLRNKSGYHAQTIQERRELGRQGAIASGKEPWNEETIDYLVSLVANPEYRYPEDHNHRGLPNWQKITEELNSKYGMDRSVNAMKLTYHRASHR